MPRGTDKYKEPEPLVVIDEDVGTNQCNVSR